MQPTAFTDSEAFVLSLISLLWLTSVHWQIGYQLDSRRGRRAIKVCSVFIAFIIVFLSNENRLYGQIDKSCYHQYFCYRKYKVPSFPSHMHHNGSAGKVLWPTTWKVGQKPASASETLMGIVEMRALKFTFRFSSTSIRTRHYVVDTKLW